MQHRVAIVTPIYRNVLGSDELISLESIRCWLRGNDHFAVVPEFLSTECPGGFASNRILAFADSYFGSPQRYNWLLLTSEFYRSFKSYDYLLIAQLDSLVLSNQLEEWCEKGYDYVGAPWAEKYDTREGVKFRYVGNGGFSLRKVDSALRVLNSKISQLPNYTIGPKPTWWHWQRVRRMVFIFGAFRALLPKITVERFLKRHFLTNEDVFWGRYASQLDSSFFVPSVDEAIRFAFEADPRGSFARTGNQLPFGCHAWGKYDRAFWIGMLTA
jgi:hypothetical protein